MKGCDIIIPVWNQLEVTKECVNSVIRNTRFPYRLIVIDNGSNVATKAYLASLNRLKGIHIVLKTNEKNEGFIKAVNRGITLSTKDLVCVLNNDCVVTKGWLTRMAEVAGESKDIGIVNPSSNTLGQKPTRQKSIDALAAELSHRKGEYVDLGTAVGFCMLIKREVINEIGSFDEAYGMGNFEDTDFSMRAVKAGYKCVRAVAAYVYHKENRSFNLIKSFKKDFEKNKKIFESRWGRQERALFVLKRPESMNGDLFKKIGKELEGNNWVYVACRKKSPGLAPHSRIIFYDFSSNFGLRIFLKILFKKKRFDKIYCDSERFLRLMRLLQPVHKASVSAL